MPHKVERAVDAGVAGAEHLVPWQIGEGVSRCVRVAEEQELHTLLAVVEHQLVIKNYLGDLKRTPGDVLAPGGTSAGVGELLGSIFPQPAGTVCLRNDAGAHLGEHCI